MKGLFTIIKNAWSLMALTSNKHCNSSQLMLTNRTSDIVPKLNGTYHNTYGDDAAIASTFVLSIIWMLFHA